ncbi:DUF4326 domain-containing protein [Rhodococcus rhodnii]|uniref:DUF4326 domain-containing protein n=2 Tax=Rhodococcus rhodnii TaxID=38312 RepID=R7WRJ6_9NOCA|nr:DUF4326 domain-containing protein [Rhodococcus rhodnii]EOM77926.1 hypothetical protein Rrhod_0735 [Rhodococcus rhodnii LMG 5362]TXG90296.1 DUF4326 domain-containing protein [Rhodococcus rhodnii]
MTAPKRIQRKRTRGWRMPENTVYVGRPTKWRNPFAVDDGFVYRIGALTTMARGRAEAVLLYKRGLAADHYQLRYEGGDWRTNVIPTSVDDIRRELAGRDLACWCPLDAPCHADVLLELAAMEDI